jgi:hypothetical protein
VASRIYAQRILTFEQSAPYKLESSTKLGFHVAVGFIQQRHGDTMGLIVSIVIAIIMCVIAYKKGFNPAFWFLAGGIIGFIVLLTLKSAAAPEIDEAERMARRKRANTIGGVLSAIAIVITVILILVQLH